MTTRLCSDCGQSKSIQGIWYLRADPAIGPFVCETCFRSPASPLAATAPRMHTWNPRLPTNPAAGTVPRPWERSAAGPASTRFP